MTLADARATLAAAVTAAGVKCAPYPPDTLSVPGAFVDNLVGDTSDPSAGWPVTFCLPTTVTATIVTLAQRHDRAGGLAWLEGTVAPILEALKPLPGMRVAGWSSGTLSLGGQDLPAVVYTLTFNA